MKSRLPGGRIPEKSEMTRNPAIIPHPALLLDP